MTEAATNDFLEKESLPKLMRRYSVPCVVAMIVATLYNIVDQIFIANADYLGSYGNAASSVVFPLTVFAIAFAVMIGDACCAFSSISLGAREPDNARRGTGSSIVLTVAIGVVLMVVFLVFQDPILTMFGARVNEETFRMSKEYFLWIAIGVPFYIFGQAMNPIVRSDGGPRFAMATLLTGAFLNIALDPLFIFVFRWGMTGAALATIIGQIVSALMFAWYLFHMKAIKLDRDSLKFRPGLMKKILPLGTTSLLTQLAIVIALASVLNMVKKYGAMDPIFGLPEYSHIPTAVVGIAMKLYQIAICIAIGLATGCIPIAGYNVGARRHDRVRELMKLLLLTEAVIGLIFCVVFMIFPRQIVTVFGAAQESSYYMDFAVKCIRIFMSSAVLFCVNKGAVIFYQSLGEMATSTLLSMLREVFIAASMPLILPIFFGLDGILYFMVVADVVSIVVTLIVVARTNKQLKAAESEPEEEREVERFRNVPVNPAVNGVITIGRSYGSGGRTIGKLVAQRLNIPYYDTELLAETAASSGLNRKLLESVDERAVRSGYQYAGYVSGQSSHFEHLALRAQYEQIEKLAAEGGCVIVGRRADQILKGREYLFRVFVTAPLEVRAARVAERESLSLPLSLQKVKRVDKERSAYYNQHSATPWGSADTYDLCVDTDKMGMEKTAELIAEAVLHMEK